MSQSYHILIFYVPEDHVETVKHAVFAAGGGRLGNYDSCCWQTSGTGQFRPLAGSSPYIGKHDELEKAREIRVEMICAESCLQDTLAALKESHPYETPAFAHWPVQGME